VVRGGSLRVRLGLLILLLAVGAALRLDAFSTGFYSDDYQQLAMLRGDFPIARPSWDLFWFGPRTADERARLSAFGLLPWWAVPEHKIAMFRPLSSALLGLDAQLFGDDALGFHLHSFAWWALLVCAVGTLLWRLLPPASAALGLLLFAFAGAHDVPVCWIANRSTLVAACFGVLALYAQVHAIERNAPRGLWLAALGWSCALSAGEYGFGMLAYALAHVWLAPAARAAGTRVRLAAMLAAGVPAGAYLALRAALGHGVVASGLYVNPSDPRFLSTAPARWLALSGELVLGLPAKALWAGAPLRNWILEQRWLTPRQWQALPDWPAVHGALGALAIGLLVIGMRWLARRNVPELPTLRWLLTGSALGVLSAGAALPESRLLVAPAIGTCAALAAFLMQALVRVRQPLGVDAGKRSKRARLEATALHCAVFAIVIAHGVLGIYGTRSAPYDRKQRADAARRFAFSAPIPVRAAGLDVVLLASGDFSTGTALPWIRRLHGASLPRSYQRLSGAVAPHFVRGIDAHTVELDVIGSSPGAFAGSLYRPATEPLLPGQRRRLPNMAVEVIAVRDGEPVRFRVRFDRPLEDPSLLWLHAFRGGLRRIAPPRPGEQILLPPAAAAWD
jgi:hypothetical protein